MVGHGLGFWLIPRAVVFACVLWVRVYLFAARIGRPDCLQSSHLPPVQAPRLHQLLNPNTNWPHQQSRISGPLRGPGIACMCSVHAGPCANDLERAKPVNPTGADTYVQARHVAMLRRNEQGDKHPSADDEVDELSDQPLKRQRQLGPEQQSATPEAHAGSAAWSAEPHAPAERPSSAGDAGWLGPHAHSPGLLLRAPQPSSRS